MVSSTRDYMSACAGDHLRAADLARWQRRSAIGSV
jgi:hypothetical protein